MTMTTDAKRALSRTIRGLRETLLTDLHESTESAYRLSLKAKDAVLSEASRVRRDRLEAWVNEQVRALPKKEKKGAEARFRLEVEKDAAAALLQRLVYLRLLEASGLRSPKVVMGGWESQGYRDFRQLAPELAKDDETEGYAALLRLVFDELAVDLPGLFGDVRLTSLVPVPAKTLRAVVEALDDTELESCWTDDMTLGWIYQYWNDPEREAIDAKMNDGGKVENHEIASKTQMFTERYMVDWLLQNSLGPMWLAMCKKHGWTPEVEADGTLAGLEESRVAFRAKREAGEVELTELMPLHSDAERRWAYYVPQPIPEDAVTQATESVRELKILDPAVGSGHFLVVAFDLLVALYREEARQRGEEGQEQWSDKAIVENILEHNLHGIDLDPHAVQIAAAALLLKAKLTCADAHPSQMNLVASKLGLSSLPADDPSRTELRDTLERETGIPGELTERLLDALAGADHLGSLLKIDAAVDAALADCEALLTRLDRTQGDLFSDDWKDRRTSIDVEEAKSTLLSRLEDFLHAHSRGDDLGLKLRGEQLASGVRFARMLKTASYDLVVANPPYQGTSKMSDAAYIRKQYTAGRADLYAAFLLRGTELLRPNGLCAMITMRNWMFVRQFQELREAIWLKEGVAALADLHFGAFEEVKDVSVALVVLARSQETTNTVAVRPVERHIVVRDAAQPSRNAAGLICPHEVHPVPVQLLQLVKGVPLIYWWDAPFLQWYVKTEKLGDEFEICAGMATQDNPRFVRLPWEIAARRRDGLVEGRKCSMWGGEWPPFIKGAEDKQWFEPLSFLVNWKLTGLEIKVNAEAKYGSVSRIVQSTSWYARTGIATKSIGRTFSARLHCYPGIISNMGSSVFPPASGLANMLALLNSSYARGVLEDLNPGVHFEVGDVERLPLRPQTGAEQFLQTLRESFDEHEKRRENSVEFESPGPSPWRRAQEWAQMAVDRRETELLPERTDDFEPEPPTDHVSFALGIAIGRLGANDEGILDSAKVDRSATLPAGICFLNATLDSYSTDDSLGHTAVELLRAHWGEYGPAIDAATDLRTWLRLKFFKDVHKDMYDKRPIYFPLSSAQKTFVAFVSIHRWDENTLRALLAEHLHPALLRLEGELPDLRAARNSADKKAARDAEGRYGKVTAWKTELADFIANVEQCAEKGPPAPDNKTPEREVDARYDPDLDDGVMINSAALWPLLEPQWKDPKKWWKELATSKGKKDYDWAHLAARYFPTRVDAKCQDDPSLGVAHGCFWKYHPEVAYKWELRLQDEIAPDFTIDEPDSNTHRATFESEYPDKVQELVAKEQKRRDAKRKKQGTLDFGERDIND